MLPSAVLHVVVLLVKAGGLAVVCCCVCADARGGGVSAVDEPAAEGDANEADVGIVAIAGAAPSVQRTEDVYPIKATLPHVYCMVLTTSQCEKDNRSTSQTGTAGRAYYFTDRTSGRAL